jgi:hypothetical protein
MENLSAQAAARQWNVPPGMEVSGIDCLSVFQQALEKEMAFVNERITGNDQERYRIPEIKRRIVPGHYLSPSTCTIDHERGIYLIEAGEHREEHRPTGLYGWVFMWHGHELWVETKELARGGESNAPGWSRKRVTRLDRMGEELRMLGVRRHLPPELEPHREEILKDLYDALLAYRTFGVFSSNYTSFDLALEFAEGV